MSVFSQCFLSSCIHMVVICWSVLESTSEPPPVATLCVLVVNCRLSSHADFSWAACGWEGEVSCPILKHRKPHTHTQKTKATNNPTHKQQKHDFISVFSMLCWAEEQVSHLQMKKYTSSSFPRGKQLFRRGMI